MATPLILEAVHTRGSEIDTFDLVLRFPAGVADELTQLTLTSVMRLHPEPGTAVLVEQFGSRTTVSPTPDRHGLDDRSWSIDGVRARFRARHANDGPVSAYVVLSDGTVLDVDVRPSTTTTGATTTVATTMEASATGPEAATEPAPATEPDEMSPATGTVRSDAGRRLLRHIAPASDRVPSTLHLSDRGGPIAAAWAVVADLTDRLGLPVVLLDEASSTSAEVTWQVDEHLGAGEFRLELGADGATLAASTEHGFRHGLLTATKWLLDHGVGLVVDDGPAYDMRVVHLDVARRWYEPSVILRLLDIAAWLQLSHVHLHFTDDEAWRLPIADIPRLGERGGTRGHLLPVGALCGSGAAPYGRCYTPSEIAGWVRRADSLGLTLIPEVDVPGHCHAALTAVPELRDPGDETQVASIQGFVDNALIPGHEHNDWFFESVFSAVADLFPSSPHIHIGGDEVPTGAWAGSPIARRFAAERSIPPADLYRMFFRQIIDRARQTTGRPIAAWEEAATSGAMRPDDGYVVTWTSPDVAQQLASKGFEVVASPAQAYYLDIAQSTDWAAPGASWAGHASIETTRAFEPAIGWPADDLARLLGVQACIWSEHVASLGILDELVFPRLEAIAARAWNGDGRALAPWTSRSRLRFDANPDRRR